MNSEESFSPAITLRGRLRKFSLRALFIVVGIVAVICACFAWLFRKPSYPILQISSPVVSPSANKIAFVTLRGDNRFFDWQRTGDEMAFKSFRETIDVRISIVSLVSGKTIHTNAETILSSIPMTWAPDQSHIVFVSGRINSASADNYMGLCSIDLENKNQSRIAAAKIWMPQFSPMGTFLGYVRGNDLIVERWQTRERYRVQSGVSHYDWCWSAKDTDVFYIRDGLAVCQFNLQSNSERVLFATVSANRESPAHVVSSPDGSQVGYHFNGWFHTVDLKSRKTKRHFKCDHYFLNFDWNETGICYVDKLERHGIEMSKVMVFQPATSNSSLVVIGPFDHACWLGKSQILVRKGNDELWAYAINDKKGVKLFGNNP